MRPVLLDLGAVEILAAPVFAGLAAMASAWYMHRRRAHAGLSPETYWDLMLPLAVGTIAGGVLLYIALYGGGPARNLEALLRSRRFGGGAFYGDLAGAFLAAALWCRWKGLPFRPVADLVGAAAPLGLAVMRLGCLQHGCCFGRPADLPWAVVFSDRRSAVKRSLLGDPLHPSQLYELAAAAAIFLVIERAVLPRAGDGRLPKGSAFLAFVVLYGGARFLLDFARGSDPGLWRPFGLSTAQGIALLSAAAAAWAWNEWRKTPA